MVTTPAETSEAATPGLLAGQFGPFIAGADVVVLFEVMMGDTRSFPADPAGYESLLAARGIEQLPNPPIELPDWLQDTRS